MDDNEPIRHHDVEKLSEALARKDVAYLFGIHESGSTPVELE